MKTLTLAPTEEQFQQQVITLAKAAGWLTYHTRDSRRSEPGFPDLVLSRGPACGRPRVIFAELKTETGRLSPAQLDWLETLRHCPDIESYIWRPSQWPEIVATLQRESRPTIAAKEAKRA